MLFVVRYDTGVGRPRIEDRAKVRKTTLGIASSKEDQALIKRAAELEGKKLSSWGLSVLKTAARRVLRKHGELPE